MARKDLLSEEMKVACAIFEMEERGEKVWFSKLVDRLRGEMAPSTILRALRTLTDFGVIKAQFGETDKGRAGRLYSLSGETKDIIKGIYEKFWKQ